MTVAEKLYGDRDSNFRRFANGLRDVLGNPVGIDLRFFIIRRRSGRGFEIRDEPALGRRFAENAQLPHSTSVLSA